MGWHYWQNESGRVWRDKTGEGLKGYRSMTKAEGDRAYREQLGQELWRYLQDAHQQGEEHRYHTLQIFVITRTIARSGMCRVYDFYVVRNGSLSCITYDLAVVCGLQMHKDRGLIVRGCNTDLAHDTVYNALHAIGQPSFRFEIRRI
jgi:hypothetical protein